MCCNYFNINLTIIMELVFRMQNDAIASEVVHDQ